MGYTFTDGAVATKAQLDSTLPGRLIQAGTVNITPIANTSTLLHVTFDVPFISTPNIVATAADDKPGSQVVTVTIANRTASGFDVLILRTNTTVTPINWTAWVAPVLFTSGAPAYAGVLNQASDAPIVQVGAVSITPVANTPTSQAVTFPTAFSEPPTVVCSPLVGVPGSVVRGVSVTDITETGCIIWIYRTSTTATTVNWIAIPS